MKLQARKKRTQSKVFSKYVTNFWEHLMHLSIWASERPQLLTEYLFRHRCFQKLLLFLMFLRNAVLINTNFCTVVNLFKKFLHQIKYQGVMSLQIDVAQDLLYITSIHSF